MLILLSILLLFIPTIFQYMLGNILLKKPINIKFVILCILSLISQLILTIISFKLSINSILKSGNRCATGAVGILVFSFFITLLLLVTILYQFTNRKNIKK